MIALAAAIFTAAVSVLLKLATDSYQRHQEKRTLAASLVGELRGYIMQLRSAASAMDGNSAELGYAVGIKQFLIILNALVARMIVFEKSAGRLGLLDPVTATHVTFVYYQQISGDAWLAHTNEALDLVKHKDLDLSSLVARLRRFVQDQDKAVARVCKLLDAAAEEAWPLLRWTDRVGNLLLHPFRVFFSTR